MITKGHLQYIKLSIDSPETDDPSQEICIRAYAPCDESMKDYLDGVPTLTPRSRIVSIAIGIFSQTPATLEKIVATLNQGADTKYEVSVHEVNLNENLLHDHNRYPPTGDGGIFVSCK